MKTYFYVIEWHDGSGKTSGLLEEGNAEAAFFEVQQFFTVEQDGEKREHGTIIDFKRVE